MRGESLDHVLFQGIPHQRHRPLPVILREATDTTAESITLLRISQ
jgi:hypothetical protein